MKLIGWMLQPLPLLTPMQTLPGKIHLVPLHKKNNFIEISVCPCHILHNAACKAASEYATIMEFDLEGHCVDLYYRFEKSIRQKSAVKEIVSFVTPMDFSTWHRFNTLDLPRVLHKSTLRSLKQWIKDQFKDLVFEFHVLFLQIEVPLFTKFKILRKVSNHSYISYTVFNRDLWINSQVNLLNLVL